MEKFETLVKIYFDKPYRPEFLVKKVNKEIKNSNYDFALIKESKNDLISDNFETIFIPIFPKNKNYTFNNDVKLGKSVDNFKNFVYECCKLDYKNINIKEMLLYLFILEEYKERIINTIYYTVLDKSKDDIYEQLLKKFLSSSDKLKINKNIFDEKFLHNFLKNNEEKNNIILEEQSEDNLFNSQNNRINCLKYEYYGPEYTKKNYVLNKPNENNSKIIILYTPDFLITKKFFDKYDVTNFQVFNNNNTCPGLFAYLLEEGIKQLNNKIDGKEINDDIIDNFGIMNFNDQTVGLYLNANNTSGYYEVKNLNDNLRNYIAIENLEVVSCSSISNISKDDNKGESRKKKLTNEQKYYAEYNAHVSEEQLSLIIINDIGREILNNEIERLPRIIFYFNLYLIQSKKVKQTFAFPSKEGAYGFEEADGIFYLHSKDMILNESRDIPFLHNLRFSLFSDNSFEIDQRTKIKIEHNSFIYMEVKTSFPLSYKGEKENKVLEGLNETKILFNTIIRKSKKFYEIAKNQNKKINQIHILFLYDSLLPKSEDMLNFQIIIRNIMGSLKEKIEIKTIFDIIYFVNPASINMRKISNIVYELKKENVQNESEIKKLKEQNNELKNENDNSKKQIELLNEKIKQLESQMKKIMDMHQNNISKNKEYSTNKDNMENKEDSNMIKKINDKLNEDNEIIYNIQILKDGIICLGGQENVYIIKDNLDIITFKGCSQVVLPLKNGDLLASKYTNIYIYFYNKFTNYSKINIKDSAKKIIELKDDGGLLILLENGNLEIVKGKETVNTIYDYNKKNIISIIEINASEIAILMDDEKDSTYKILIFYDLIKQEEINRLNLESKTSINNVGSFYIYNNYLYVSLSDAFFIIDIDNKKQETKVDYGFSKIYGFANNIFGIKNNEIYKVIKENNNIKKELLYKDVSDIYCMQLIEEKTIILSTGKEIKYYNFN